MESDQRKEKKKKKARRNSILKKPGTENGTDKRRRTSFGKSVTFDHTKSVRRFESTPSPSNPQKGTVDEVVPFDDGKSSTGSPNLSSGPSVQDENVFNQNLQHSASPGGCSPRSMGSNGLDSIPSRHSVPAPLIDDPNLTVDYAALHDTQTSSVDGSLQDSFLDIDPNESLHLPGNTGSMWSDEDDDCLEETSLQGVPQFPRSPQSADNFSQASSEQFESPPDFVPKKLTPADILAQESSGSDEEDLALPAASSSATRLTPAELLAQENSDSDESTGNIAIPSDRPSRPSMTPQDLLDAETDSDSDDEAAVVASAIGHAAGSASSRRASSASSHGAGSASSGSVSLGRGPPVTPQDLLDANNDYADENDPSLSQPSGGTQNMNESMEMDVDGDSMHLDQPAAANMDTGKEEMLVSDIPNRRVSLPDIDHDQMSVSPFRSKAVSRHSPENLTTCLGDGGGHVSSGVPVNAQAFSPSDMTVCLEDVQGTGASPMNISRAIDSPGDSLGKFFDTSQTVTQIGVRQLQSCPSPVSCSLTNESLTPARHTSASQKQTSSSQSLPQVREVYSPAIRIRNSHVPQRRKNPMTVERFMKEIGLGYMPLPLAGGKEPIAGDKQPLASDVQPVAGGTQPLAGGTQPLAGGTQPLAGEDEKETELSFGEKLLDELYRRPRLALINEDIADLEARTDALGRERAEWEAEMNENASENEIFRYYEEIQDQPEKIRELKEMFARLKVHTSISAQNKVIEWETESKRKMCAMLEKSIAQIEDINSKISQNTAELEEQSLQLSIRDKERNNPEICALREQIDRKAVEIRRQKEQQEQQKHKAEKSRREEELARAREEERRQLEYAQRELDAVIFTSGINPIKWSRTRFECLLGQDRFRLSVDLGEIDADVLKESRLAQESDSPELYRDCAPMAPEKGAQRMSGHRLAVEPRPPVEPHLAPVMTSLVDPYRHYAFLEYSLKGDGICLEKLFAECTHKRDLPYLVRQLTQHCSMAKHGLDELDDLYFVGVDGQMEP
eukprot:28527_1